MLLIVPYGIETKHRVSTMKKQVLLIVPYGIETTFGMGNLRRCIAFNCTLWN